MNVAICRQNSAIFNDIAIRYSLFNIQHLKYDLPKILKLLFSLFLVVRLNTAGYKSKYSFNLLRLWLSYKIVTYFEGTLYVIFVRL